VNNGTAKHIHDQSPDETMDEASELQSIAKYQKQSVHAQKLPFEEVSVK